MMFSPRVGSADKRLITSDGGQDRLGSVDEGSPIIPGLLVGSEFVNSTPLGQVPQPNPAPLAREENNNVVHDLVDVASI